MQDIPFVQIVVLLALVLAPLITSLLERIRRRYQTQPPRLPPPQPAPRTFAQSPPAKSPPVDVISSRRDRVPAPREATVPLRSRPQLRNRQFLYSRRELRRAIVLMEVLGPCRGNHSRYSGRD
jgi:hypothetical protein